MCRGIAIVLLALISTSVVRAAEPSAPVPSSAAPLGSPDYRPTPQQPFGWRGDGSGAFPGATPVTEWSAKKNVRWSAVVGNSYSSPILTDKFVFVTSEPNLLTCINRADGKEQWKIKVLPSGLPDEKSQKAAAKYKPPDAGAGMAAATPVTDGTTVYTLFANGILCAVGLDEKPKWITYIDARRAAGYGRSSSPILYAGKLFVHMTDLYAFDPATGKQLWVNNEAKSNYGTPVGMKIGGVDLIVTSAGDVVRVDDGKSVNSAIGQTLPRQPDRQRRHRLFRRRRRGGGSAQCQVQRQRALEHHGAGRCVQFAGVARQSAIHLDRQGRTVRLRCQRKGSKRSDHRRKAVVRRRCRGRAASPAAPPGGDVPGGATPIDYASITLAGKYLFLNSTQGDIVVLEATREAKQVAKNTLPDGSGSSPIFSGGDMFLRDGNKLFCIGK